VLISGATSLTTRQNGSATSSSRGTVQLSEGDIGDIVERALAEDLGAGDVTTELLVSSDMRACGSIVAKQEGILAGVQNQAR